MASIAIAILRKQLQDAEKWSRETFEGVSESMLQEQMSEKAIPIGPQYIHIISSVDMMINGMFRNEKPLMEEAFKGKTGFSEAPDWNDMIAWGKRVTISLSELKAYAKAVFETADQYLGDLTDEDLSTEVDLSSWGMGKQPRSYLVSIAVSNTAMHTGEISFMKGLKGLQGYPM